MHAAFALFTSLLFLFSKGQSPGERTVGGNPADYVPKGWSIIDSSSGDLNKDGRSDIAMVVQSVDSVLAENDMGDTVFSRPRMLIILFSDSLAASFTLAEKTSTFILPHDNPNMDDPFTGVKIIRGILEIKFHTFYHSGSWYESNAAYKFRFQEGEFKLIGAEHYSYHRASRDFEHYSYNFVTGKRALTKGNQENEKKATTTWKQIEEKTLRTFKSFKAPFTFEVEKNVYI